MFQPLVSIIVPIYNTQRYLKKCLDSICNQSFSNIEILLVNDGSTDESLSIITEYEKMDNRLSVIDHNNAGVSVARNIGLNKAKGDYVLFIDSDDWIEKDMVETLVNNAILSHSDIACCQYDKSVRNDISKFEVWNQEKTLKEFIIHKKINGSLVNKLIKRELIDRIRFDPKIKYGEDALFCWQCLIKINSFCITNKILYHVTMHEDSASGGGSYKPIRRDCIVVWEKITDSAAVISDRLKTMSRAQLANMAFYSLYEMYYYDYYNTEDEACFIKELKSRRNYLLIARFIPLKIKVFAFLITQRKFSRTLIGRFKRERTIKK